MTRPFKIGDRVRCIEPRITYGLNEGVYTIKTAESMFGTHKVEEVESWWSARRFVLIKNKWWKE